MPSPAPTDYRVDWAKSGESYQSYKVDEGHVYPEGSATTVTITDLEAGTEYKVRMRARYNQGEHADSPWSGPWQEGSLTVAAEPTPEPTAEPAPEPTAEPTEEPEDGAIGSPTATDDNAGGLVIAWQAPQAPHDAPTDYRVNWARSDDDIPVVHRGARQRLPRHDPPIPSKAWTATPSTKSASAPATLRTVSTTLTGAGRGRRSRPGWYPARRTLGKTPALRPRRPLSGRR